MQLGLAKHAAASVIVPQLGIYASILTRPGDTDINIMQKTGGGHWYHYCFTIASDYHQSHSNQERIDRGCFLAQQVGQATGFLLLQDVQRPHYLGNMYAGPLEFPCTVDDKLPIKTRQECSLRLLRLWCLLLLLLLLLERLCLFHCEPLAPPAALCCLHVLQGRLINLLSTTAHGSTTVMPSSKQCCQSIDEREPVMQMENTQLVAWMNVAASLTDGCSCGSSSQGCVWSRLAMRISMLSD